jgi:hypothetical protein
MDIALPGTMVLELSKARDRQYVRCLIAARRSTPSPRQDNMDRASQVLAQGVPPSVPNSYRALADHHGNISYSTLYHRARGRPSREEKAQGQEYLKPYEEEVIVKYLLQMADLGYPIRMKFIPSLAYSVTRHRPTTERPPKAPGRN